MISNKISNLVNILMIIGLLSCQNIFKNRSYKEFEEYKANFHKKYLSKNEQKYRQAVFAETLKKIKKYKEDKNVTFELV